MRTAPSVRRLSRALLLASVASSLVHGEQLAPAALRYDLQPGDHAVYRERIDRTVTGEDSEDQVVVEWTTHVVTTGACQGCSVVGTQRTRTSAQLVRSMRGGRNVTAAERKTFEEELAARPTVVSDANWFDPSGVALLPATATREWRSLLLPGVREIEPLPERGVSVGDTWVGRSMLGFAMTAAPCAPPADADCLLIQGQSGSSRLRAWLSRAQRVITRLAVSGEYDSGSFHAREEITFELVERRRGERLIDWLSLEETRSAALAALHVSPNRPLPVERLYELLEGADEETERQVLAVALQWHAAPPRPEVIERLVASPNPRVRALAARLGGRPAAGPDPMAAGATAPPGGQRRARRRSTAGAGRGASAANSLERHCGPCPLRASPAGRMS